MQSNKKQAQHNGIGISILFIAAGRCTLSGAVEWEPLVGAVVDASSISWALGQHLRRFVLGIDLCHVPPARQKTVCSSQRVMISPGGEPSLGAEVLSRSSPSVLYSAAAAGTRWSPPEI